jgi:hypothetical protein
VNEGIMSRLEINDISFCQTLIDTQVTGGFDLGSASGLDLYGLLKLYASKFELPEFEQYSSEQKEGYTIEKFTDESGDGYGYQITSEDGKQQSGGAVWQTDNVTFGTSFTSSST